MEKKVKEDFSSRTELYEYIDDLVNNYKTKSEYGFKSDEQQELIEIFPNINMKKYEDALDGITCAMDESDGGFIIYHCDIKTALKCAVEDRNITASEWD